MARKVIMSVPFEGFGGSLRNKQDLRYAENDNKAFEAPLGRQYARNYKPSIVITHFAKTGKQSFQIKTKSATKITTQSLMNMAVLGGAGAIIGAILANKVAPLYVALDQAYAVAVKSGELRTFRAWLSDKIQYMLKNKQNSCIFGNPVLVTTRINNPWVAGGTGTNVTIAQKTLLKFALQLCPVAIAVDGKYVAGVPSTSMKFDTFVPSNFNNGDFALVGEDTQYVEYKGTDLYKEDGVEVVVGDDVAYGEYTTIPANA